MLDNQHAYICHCLRSSYNNIPHHTAACVRTYAPQHLAKGWTQFHIELDTKFTQAGQGSDMNVISTGLVRHLSLELHSLSEVGFKGLSMRTADHRETILHHWLWLRIVVAGILRDIRCFVAPELTSEDEFTSYRIWNTTRLRIHIGIACRSIIAIKHVREALTIHRRCGEPSLGRRKGVPLL